MEPKVRNKNPQHTVAVKERALQLYFEIEKHFALGGSALSLRDVSKLLGLSSSASAQLYIKILKQRGLITNEPNSVRTIVLAKTGYPIVVYSTPTGYTEPLYFQRS